MTRQANSRRAVDNEDDAPAPPPPSRPLTPAQQTTVDQAAQSINTATINPPEHGQPSTVNPTAGSDEVREQLEAHPELADEILAASDTSLDAINESINEPGQSQEVVNATVDNLAQATEKAGPYGQDRLGQTVAPASGNSDHVKVALASSTSPGAARLTETTSNHVPPGARAGFRQDVATVREAASAVSQSYAQSPTQHSYSPAGAALTLQQQVEAHPELASMITQASQPTLEQIGTYLESHPGETATIQSTVVSLSAVADASGQDGDDLLVDTLGGLPPDNAGLVNGIAEASLNNQVDLGSELAERHGETAGVPLLQATQVGSHVREIDALLASDDLPGAYAASQLLRSYAEDAPQGVSTYLLRGLDELGSVERMTGILGRWAEVSDGSYLDGYVEGTAAHAFDGVVADLSFVATRSGDLEITQELGRDLANSMNPDDIERYDEAFHNAVANGNGADLTAAVIEELAASGRTDQAEHVLDELDDGLNTFREGFEEAANKRDEAYAELGYLQQQFGPLGTEEEQAAAAQAFLDRFPEIDQVERFGGVMATDLDVIARLRESVPQLDVDSLDDNEEDMLRQFPHFANTASGSERVAEALDAQSRGYSTFLDRLTTVDLDGDERTEFLENSGLALNRAAIQQASGAVAVGDLSRSDRILDGLLEVDGAAELQGVANIEDLTPVIAAMKDVAAAGSGDDPPNSVLQSAHGGLQTAVQDLEARGIDLSDSPRLQLLTGGAAFLGAAGVLTGDKPENFEEWVGSIATLSESTLEGGQVIAALRGANPATLGRFAAGARVAGLVGVGLSTWSAVNAASDGDWAAAGLHAGGAVGGALLALGTTATATGVGAVLVVGAAAGLYQLDRVRASNVHENENTEAYIRELLPEGTNSEVIRHLRNSDDEGVNAGIVFQAAAQRLDVDLPQFFDDISRLSPDQVLELVESAHGLVGENTTSVDALRQTHGSDGDVGQLVQYQNGYYYRLDQEGRLITGEPLSPEEQERLTEHTRDQYRVKASPLGDTLISAPMGTEVIAPSSVQGFINYMEYLTGQSLD